MKKKIIIIVTVLVLLIGCGVGVFILNKNKSISDAEKFKKEYSEVSETNVFTYRSAEEIINILKNGSGVVYLGFPECQWCQAYVKLLNEVALDVGIDKIYYYNILEDRKNNTKEYQEIVSILGDHLQYDEEGNHRIYVPNVSFHVKGEIIGNDYETSLDTHNLKDPKEYWTEEEVNDLKSRLKGYMEEVFATTNMCTDCNK